MMYETPAPSPGLPRLQPPFVAVSRSAPSFSSLTPNTTRTSRRASLSGAPAAASSHSTAFSQNGRIAAALVPAALFLLDLGGSPVGVAVSVGLLSAYVLDFLRLPPAAPFLAVWLSVLAGQLVFFFSASPLSFFPSLPLSLLWPSPSAPCTPSSSGSGPPSTSDGSRSRPPPPRSSPSSASSSPASPSLPRPSSPGPPSPPSASAPLPLTTSPPSPPCSSTSSPSLAPPPSRSGEGPTSLAPSRAASTPSTSCSSPSPSMSLPTTPPCSPPPPPLPICSSSSSSPSCSCSTLPRAGRCGGCRPTNGRFRRFASSMGGLRSLLW